MTGEDHVSHGPPRTAARAEEIPFGDWFGPMLLTRRVHRVSRSQVGGLSIQRVPFLIAFWGLVTIIPSWAQNQEPRPTPRWDEITIPSEGTLERDAVTSPKNEFPTDDAAATRQLERQNKRIDREVREGICTDC